MDSNQNTFFKNPTAAKQFLAKSFGVSLQAYDRFLADWEMEHQHKRNKPTPPSYHDYCQVATVLVLEAPEGEVQSKEDRMEALKEALEMRAQSLKALRERGKELNKGIFHLATDGEPVAKRTRGAYKEEMRPDFELSPDVDLEMSSVFPRLNLTE